MTILLEQIQEQNRATIEAVQSQGTSIRREMGELERRLEGRIDALEAAVRQNSADIRQNSADIRQNSADIRQHSAEIRQNSEDIRQHSADIRQNSADIRQQADEVRKVREQLAGLTGLVGGKPDAAALEALDARVTHLERRIGV
jgi:methyl-accepting chemotaxis protein